MEVLRTNVDNKKDLFRLTHAQSAQKVQDLVGQCVTVDKYVLYLDGDAPEEGEEDSRKRVLALDLNGEAYGTISKTLIDSLLDILDVFEDDDDWAVEIKDGTSKNGRRFIYAVVV